MKFFHLHQWAKWRDYETVAHYWFEADGDPDYRTLTQIKECSVCGKKKRRSMRL